MDLKCRKTKCKYNKGFCCCAKTLIVNEKTICDTFEDDPDKKVPDTSRYLMQEAPFYFPHKEKKSFWLTCSANHCIFNEDGKCSANGLTINDVAKEPVCMTYLRK